MNLYLTRVGERVKDVREWLDWTQTELANRTGISRATIVNIENEPWRLQRTWAFAIFTVITADLLEKQKLVENESVHLPINELLSALGLTSSKMWSRLLGPTSLTSSNIFSLVGGFTGSKIAASFSLTGALSKNKDQELRSAARSAITELTHKLHNAFELSSLRSDEFVRKIDDNEVPE